MGKRYRLTRLFARGGMAEVYLGLAQGAEGFEKPVAIKRVLPHLSKDERIARMFVSEAKLATYLSHQNIVQVFDVGRGPDGLFIAMELVNGWDLGAVIDEATRAQTAFSPPLAAFVASQALAGLCHAYKQKVDGKAIIIAHRDISPSNILVSAEGEVKVADFGIARIHAPLSQTEPGTFKGKIAYSAPEVLQGQAASSASDQFSLAIILHEMLTGAHPFGRFDNPMAYMEAIVHRAPAPLPGVPELLSKIVTRALAKSPRDRFESPESFARSVAQFLASCGSPSTTQEMSEFVRHLKLPALPLDHPSQDTVIRDRLPGSFSLDSMPVLEHVTVTGLEERSWQAGEVEALQKDWVPQGPELDASGQLRGDPIAKPTAPQPLPPSPKGLRPVDEVKEVELAVPPAPPQPTSPRKGKGEPPACAGVAEILADAEKRSEHRRRGRIFKFAALCALIAGAAWKGPFLYSLIPRRLIASVRGTSSMAILSIHSEPSGAKIQIGSQVLGETPLFIENQYPNKPIEVRLSLQGYHPWTGKFVGGESAELRATMRRR